MDRYVIVVHTTNPDAREHIRALTEDTLKGVDVDRAGRLHETTIDATDDAGGVIWSTNLRPDES